MQSLTKQFVKEVERKILTGEWKAGEKIPALRVLAEQFHVSRSVINAGIVELCNNGYLVTVPRRYIIVSDWRKTGNFALLNGLMENELCDVDFFDDFLEGRMTIETAIARKAAEARTEEDLAGIEAVLKSEAECVSPEQYAESDREFHNAIAVASHNMIYSVILNSFNSVSDKFVREFYNKKIDLEFVSKTHSELYEAIKGKRPDDAEKVMRKLLAHGENELKK